jgi:hypothetical protein
MKTEVYNFADVNSANNDTSRCPTIWETKVDID